METLLNKAINYLNKKSKEEKEKILNSLPDWFYSGGHICSIKDKNSPNYQNGETGSWGYPGRFLLEEDFKEIKQAIINKIVKTVQENPQEWKMVEICTFDADMHGYYTLGATKGYQEWNVMLIHQSVPLEYDEEGFLIRQPQKMYGERLFTEEELQQIKKALGISIIKKIPFQKNGYKLNKKPINNNKLDTQTITILLLFFVICAIISILLFFRKKKK